MPWFDRVAKWGKTRPLIINLPLPTFIRADVSPRTEIRQPSLLHSCHFFFRSAFPRRRRRRRFRFSIRANCAPFNGFLPRTMYISLPCNTFVIDFFLRECVKKERDVLLSCHVERDDDVKGGKCLKKNQEGFRKERREAGIVIKVYLRNRLPFSEVCTVRGFRARGLQFRWLKVSKVDNEISLIIADN